jgi:hypothetical protein
MSENFTTNSECVINLTSEVHDSAQGFLPGNFIHTYVPKLPNFVPASANINSYLYSFSGRTCTTILWMLFWLQACSSSVAFPAAPLFF